MSRDPTGKGASKIPYELGKNSVVTPQIPEDVTNENLGNPDRVARMVAEMEAYYLERLRVLEARDMDSPHELQELSARIVRLKERLRCGDPDMTADELQAAIDRAEMKWRELQSQATPGRPLSKLFATLPRGAELYRRQVVLGLSGDQNAASKARVFLRKWFGGKIRLDPLPDGGLMAHWNQNVAALVDGLGSCGSGGVICAVPSVVRSVRVK